MRCHIKKLIYCEKIGSTNGPAFSLLLLLFSMQSSKSALSIPKLKFQVELIMIMLTIYRIWSIIAHVHLFHPIIHQLQEETESCLFHSSTSKSVFIFSGKTATAIGRETGRGHNALLESTSQNLTSFLKFYSSLEIC